ncbi:conserved hypothetical protein [Pyrobaculum islandicum DSM 4184]|uniref:Uncharacterized protein n=1 Tax=Pyrobaculum islandicum (strain DSM 4184 / JCM 9189 / GEO3) TaxID=384616 RepID=A1RS98_PYRIL|nr:hypothetical protein [Pyrobaculum islandicum]ABL87830.1 conserved hypothetical protein [Pyrobaculum islandicum DSM 4184]
MGNDDIALLLYVYVSEVPVLLIRRRGLVVRKTLIKHNNAIIGEYIYVRRGLFEAEAEYDLEDGVLYYLQICWFNRCITWFEGEPDKMPPLPLLERARKFFGELAKFSQAAEAALKLLFLSKSRLF